MKASCLFFLIATAAIAQQESSQTEARRFDLNGNPINAGSFSESKVKTPNGETTTRVEYAVDVNGRKVPLMSVEETKQDVNGHTTSNKVVRRFDQNGAPTSSERIISEEETAGTTSTKKASVFRADINGNEMLDEQSVSRTNGGSATTEVLRRSYEGSLVLAERQTNVTEETADGGSKSQAVTYKKDNNGEFYVSAQEVKETVKKGNETVETSAQYVRGGQGALELAEQKVSRSVAQADGTVSKQVDVYSAAVPGLTNTTGQPVLKERQSVETRKGANGTLVETTVSRKATVDGGELSAPRVISEAVVTKKP
jgi:hypothetical protein